MRVRAPLSGATFAALATLMPLAGLLFLVFGGTFIGYTIFLRRRLPRTSYNRTEGSLTPLLETCDA